MTFDQLFLNVMTQDESWLANWKELIDFIDANKRRPSKYVDEQRGMRNWWKHQQKLMNAGELKEERVGLFMKLLETGERYRRINRFR